MYRIILLTIRFFLECLDLYYYEDIEPDGFVLRTTEDVTDKEIETLSYIDRLNERWDQDSDDK